MHLKLITALTTVAVAFASVPAHPSEVQAYECGIVSQRPATAKHETPAYKIKVEVVYMPTGDKFKLTGIAAIHTFANSDVADRTEQYVDRVVHEREISQGIESTWWGKYIKDPSVTMVGTIAVTKRNVFYTERRFKQSRLVWTLVSQCHAIEYNP